jgi:hypothetical protein
MIPNFEHDVVQNVSLGATALWTFARAYMDKVEGREGPELPMCVVVLPIVYHQRTANAIHRMQSDSSLLKALQEEPQFVVGLQRRLEALATRSFQSLNVAVASSLLEWDPATQWPRLTPNQKTLPNDLQGSLGDVPVILAAAKRLGWWFAKEDVASLCLRLGVVF